MDRNFVDAQIFSPFDVALLAEGVDRNNILSSRFPRSGVALLAEGVDRNWPAGASVGRLVVSPSSRRAWIEMYELADSSTLTGVALLAEGVDRNVLCVLAVGII